MYNFDPKKFCAKLILYLQILLSIWLVVTFAEFFKADLSSWICLYPNKDVEIV